MPSLFHWDALPEEVLSPSAAKRLLPGAGATLVRIALKAGARAERHTHAFEQFVQVVSGSGVLETEDGSQGFGPGSLFHFLPNTWHAARFDTDTILVETNLAPPAAGALQPADHRGE